MTFEKYKNMLLEQVNGNLTLGDVAKLLVIYNRKYDAKSGAEFQNKYPELLHEINKEIAAGNEEKAKQHIEEVLALCDEDFRKVFLSASRDDYINGLYKVQTLVVEYRAELNKIVSRSQKRQETRAMNNKVDYALDKNYKKEFLDKRKEADDYYKLTYDEQYFDMIYQRAIKEKPTITKQQFKDSLEKTCVKRGNQELAQAQEKYFDIMVDEMLNMDERTINKNTNDKTA